MSDSNVNTANTTPEQESSRFFEDESDPIVRGALLDQENEQIIAERSEALLGKVVQGTLIKTIRRSGKVTFWVRWNKRKCDTVLIKNELILEALGTSDPKEGTQIKCEIVALGPDISKLCFKSAWCMHPQANEIEVISHGYINPPNPNKVKELSLTSDSAIPEQRTRVPMATKTLANVQKSSPATRPRFFNSRVNDDSSNCSFGLKVRTRNPSWRARILNESKKATTKPGSKVRSPRSPRSKMFFGCPG